MTKSSCKAAEMMNIFIAAVFLLLYGMLFYPLSGSEAGSYVLSMINLTASMSVGLAMFNLLPFPPLDGSKVLFSIVPDEWYNKLMRYERYGSIIIFVLVAGGLMSKPLSAAIDAVFQLLFPLAQLGFEMVIKFL